MKKTILLIVMALLIATTVTAIKLNFRGNDAESCIIDGESEPISNLKFSFTINDETGFKPASVARASLTATINKSNRLKIKFGTVSNYFSEGNLFYAEFNNAVIYYKPKVCEEECRRYERVCEKNCVKYNKKGRCIRYRRTCEYTDNCLRYRTRCKYEKQEIQQPVLATYNSNENKFYIYSSFVKISGITGKIVGCCKTAEGRRFCGDVNSELYERICAK